MTKEFKIKASIETLDAIRQAIRIVIINHSAAEAIGIVNHTVPSIPQEIDFYRLTNLKKVHEIVQVRMLRIINGDKKTLTLKLDQVQCIAFYKAVTTSPNREFLSDAQAIALDNFLLALGKFLPSQFTKTPQQV